MRIGVHSDADLRVREYFHDRPCPYARGRASVPEVMEPQPVQPCLRAQLVPPSVYANVLCWILHHRDGESCRTTLARIRESAAVCPWGPFSLAERADVPSSAARGCPSCRHRATSSEPESQRGLGPRFVRTQVRLARDLCAPGRRGGQVTDAVPRARSAVEVFSRAGDAAGEEPVERIALVRVQAREQP